MTTSGVNARQARPQLGLFDEELEQVREQLRAREEAYHRERQARFDANKARILADTDAWKGGEFAERIDGLLGKLVDAGEPARGMHDAILGGINSAAKAGRLNESHVAFVEDKARIEVARVSTLGQVIPTSWDTRTAADLTTVDPGCTQLPEGIQKAALVRLNEVGPQLAKLGFKSELEVDSSSPADARELASDMREVHTALMLLAVNRYRNAKGYKHAKADHLERMERFASQVLNIDTKAHPGVKMDLPLTTGGVRQSAPRSVLKNSQGHAVTAEDSVARQAETTGIYVGKVTALTDTHLEQKVGRDPRDVVAHERRDLDGDDVAVGHVVTISYEMGVGRLTNRDLAVEQHGVER